MIIKDFSTHLFPLPNGQWQMMFYDGLISVNIVADPEELVGIAFRIEQEILGIPIEARL